MNFKVGDRVKIKSWEAMEKEFGLLEKTHIDLPSTFVTDMEEDMPEDRIIEVGGLESDYFESR